VIREEKNPQKHGRLTGREQFAQLDLKGRLDRSKPNYDPVAERVLLSLLSPERF
jgi:hypothetical protein